MLRKALAALRAESADNSLAGDLAARDLVLLRVALTTGRRVAELAAGLRRLPQGTQGP
jgi:hypothetical protein